LQSLLFIGINPQSLAKVVVNGAVLSCHCLESGIEVSGPDSEHGGGNGGVAACGHESIDRSLLFGDDDVVAIQVVREDEIAGHAE
jgi:hypothetical protein